MGLEHTVKKGGGVGILVANNLKYKIRPDYNNMSDHLESIFIELSTHGHHVLCGSCYRPPNTNVRDFQKDIDIALNKLKLETHQDSIIGMDHNLYLTKHAQHESTEVFINNMLENSSFPCITRPTRVTQTSSTLIDNIFINGHLHTNTRSCVVLHDISDHFPCLIMIRDMYAKKCADKTIYSCDITDSRIECLKTDLLTIDWDRLLPTENPSLCYNTLSRKLEDLLEKNMPIHEKVITYHRRACEPWLMQSLLNCGKKQLKLYSRAI